MNGKIDHMVSENAVTSDVVIDGKREIGQRPVYFIMPVIFAVKCLCYAVPGCRFEMDIGIVDNIDEIIQMPRALEAVAVNDDQANKESRK